MERLTLLVGEAEPQWLVVIGCALALALVLSRRRRAGSASTGLQRAYDDLDRSEMPERERLRRLLAERAGWRKIPDRLIRELLVRLRSKDDVFDFVGVVEGDGELTRLLRRSSGSDTDVLMRTVAQSLVGLVDRRPAEAEVLLRLAARIDPDNYVAVLALAGDHFAAGRFRDALVLLERGIPLCRNAAERPGGSSSEGPAERTHGPRELLLKSMEMYEACLDHDGSD